MPTELFVDASGWFPVAVAADVDHQRVTAALQARVRRGARIVTTNLVVAETYVLLRRRVGHAAAVTFAQTVRESPHVVVTSSPELEELAMTHWLEPFDDHAFSLTDAVSFVVMADRKISEALTLDRHFVVAGFKILPHA